MSCEIAICTRSLVKTFPIYSKPHHRLFQMVSRTAKSKWYEEFVALRGVDIQVRRGETVGIVGRNGSGKSTLLQIICGTLTPTAGEVEVNGRVAALLELGAGFNPEFTGRENIFLNGTVLGLTREEVKNRFDEIVDFSGIESFIDQPVKTYSSGMYVRLAFAVAINVTPDILIVDEALSVGDEAFQRKCFSKIEAIRDSGATVLFVSHSAGTVIELCDRAVLLDHGEVLTDGHPKHVISQYQRLLYAPTEKSSSVRKEILKEIVSTKSAVRDVEPSLVPILKTEIQGEVDLQPYWEEGLEPRSTVEYESIGVEIVSPRIETVGGDKVNVLVPHQEYVYTYRVNFLRGGGGVRCGMMIKSITGIEIGGCATSSTDSRLPWVEAGSSLDVRFRFRCLLAPGTYFLNAGVLGLVNGVETYLSRRIDVAMFRVMATSSRLATGFVDLDVAPSVIEIER